MMADAAFPQDFLWGVSTSSYQIEGAHDRDGKGPSIWDVFTHEPGRVAGGATGDIACAHYDRWREDLALMKWLGLGAYRFSVSWSRILPAGFGVVNQKGLDFYRGILEECARLGITPFLTLYHWDLPQGIADRGGIASPHFPEWFANFARVVAEHLGDLSPFVATVNQPFSVMMSYLGTKRAPAAGDAQMAFDAAENLLYAAGLAVQEYRSCRPDARLGILLNRIHVQAASSSEEDRRAARMQDLLVNDLFALPVLRGQYPEDLGDALDWFQLAPKRMADSSRLKVIASPLDFLGVNYYLRSLAQANPGADGGLPYRTAGPLPHLEYTDDPHREVYPEGLYEQLSALHALAPGLPLYITENGADIRDSSLKDERRIRYLHRHLEQVLRAINSGIPLAGYLLWTLMDCFEWESGYQNKYGLFAVDAQGARIARASALWYKKLIASGGVLTAPLA